MKYRIIPYIRTEPEEEEFFSSLEEAEKEAGQLSLFQGLETLFVIEEVPDENDLS